VVRRDIERFRQELDAYSAGQISEEEFRACRLLRGVYLQRQAGVVMVRTKIPGGRLTAAQMLQLAEIAEQFAAGRVHLTTRQDVQFHFVPLPRVPALLHRLADARVTTREAGYNTVRNVTVCPFAGLCPEEAFDVWPPARRLAGAFLYQEWACHLPRKSKIGFSGCPRDCALSAIHDIGLRAVVRPQNGCLQRGFRMVVGGGLGPLPTAAVVLEDFVPEERLLTQCTAVIRVFAKHGNRRNRHKARLEFLVREKGEEWLRSTVDRECAEIERDGGIEVPAAISEALAGERGETVAAALSAPGLDPEAAGDPEFARWLESNVVEQKQPSRVAVVVRVDQGKLTADQLRGLAGVAAEAGDGCLRTTPGQNLVLTGVPPEKLRQVHRALKRLRLGAAGAGGLADITTCPGAETCTQAITQPMPLAAALQQTLQRYDDPTVRRLTLKVSGCPNACGHHWIADIGLYGNARKLTGRWAPYYQIVLGGGYDLEGRMHFGVPVQSIAARLVPVALTRILDHYLSERAGEERFRDYVLRYTPAFFRTMTHDLAKPPEWFPDLFRDWGSEADFSLQRGQAECAA
jgi:sulfite reductase beta subunit-like hemoprotein